MRHVIYLLVISNLVYFSWNMLRNMPEAQDAGPGRRLPPIVRRLEMIEEKAASKDFLGAESLSFIDTDKPPIASPSRNAAATQEDAAVKPVEALTEVEPPGAVVPTLNCHVLGPFPDTAEMERIEKRLNELGYQPRKRTSDVPVEAGYWTYLPAMQREEALRITRRLVENHDRDYLIVKGNVISLGAYDSRTQADIRAKMLRKYGLKAVVEPRYETRTVGWLDVDLPGDGRSVLETIRAGYSTAQAQDAGCPSIAVGGVVN